MLEIKRIGNPVLREKAKDVDVSDAQLTQLIDEMKETLHEVHGLGLASNQVGILKRVFVYDLGEGADVIVNPQIVWRSDETTTDTEGCLSIPGVEVHVERAEKVTVEGYDLKGDKKSFEAEGLLARLFQHEIDHLDGTMIIDRANDEERREALRKLYGTSA